MQTFVKIFCLASVNFMLLCALASCAKAASPEENSYGLTCEQYKYEKVIPLPTPQHPLLRGEVKCMDVQSYPEMYVSIDYMDFEGKLVPVILYYPPTERSADGTVPATRRAGKRSAVYVRGGPGAVTFEKNIIIEELVEAGYSVYSPVYQGSIKSNYPDPDLPQAIAQIRALLEITGEDSVVIGASAGAYLAAAGCRNLCSGKLILGAPMILSPARLYDDMIERNGPFKRRKLCITYDRYNPEREGTCEKKYPEKCFLSGPDNDRLCVKTLDFGRAFWGSDNDVSLRDLVSDDMEKQILFIAGTQDRRTPHRYLVSAFEDSDARIELFPGYDHLGVLDAPEVRAVLADFLRD